MGVFLYRETKMKKAARYPRSHPGAEAAPPIRMILFCYGQVFCLAAVSFI